MFGSLHGMRGKLDFVLSPYKPEINTVSITTLGKNCPIPIREPDLLDPVYPGLMDCSKRAIDHFVACLANNHSSPLDGRAGRRSIEIVMAGYESQRRGTKIQLPLTNFDPDGLRKCFSPFQANGYGLVD